MLLVDVLLVEHVHGEEVVVPSTLTTCTLVTVLLKAPRLSWLTVGHPTRMN